MFQYEIIDISMRDLVSEDKPIFITRLVEDNGWSMIGGAAQVGSVGMTVAIRSDTNCLAVNRSMSFLNSMMMEESWGTDLDLMWSKPSIPLKASSRGTDHQLLHLGGGEAQAGCLDLDPRRGEFGEDIDGCTA